MIRRNLRRAISATAILSVAFLVPAGGETHGEEHAHDAASATAGMPLKKIMADLGRDMATLLDAVLTEKWDVARDASAAVAEHRALAPDDVKKIAAALGGEMAKFKQFDLKAHEAALALADAAKKKQPAEAARLYGEVVAACVGCHAAYKAKAQAALGTAHQTTK